MFHFNQICYTYNIFHNYRDTIPISKHVFYKRGLTLWRDNIFKIYFNNFEITHKCFSTCWDVLKLAGFSFPSYISQMVVGSAFFTLLLNFAINDVIIDSGTSNFILRCLPIVDFIAFSVKNSWPLPFLCAKVKCIVLLIPRAEGVRWTLTPT